MSEFKSEMTLNELKDFIKNQDIADVLIKLDLIDEEDIKGRKILCPFHDEKTPSLNLYEDSYKCYGCGAHGDAINFVSDTYDLSYVQTMGWIADSYGIKLQSGKFNPFSSHNHVSTSMIEREWKHYVEELDGQSDKIKEGAAIFFPLEVGYDSKNNYYVFRYTSKANSTLGFTKRRAFELEKPEDKSIYPKWVHSTTKNSNISQCANIYNLGMATKHIRKSKKVYMVEGPKDCIPFILSNMKNVIAVSSAHGKLLSLFEIIPDVDNVVLSMDGDEAGKKGEIAITGFLAQKMSLENVFWMNYGDFDPYDYYKKYSKLPEEEPILSLYNDSELVYLYQASSDYNKDIIVRYFSNKKSMSYTEASSFFNMDPNKKENVRKKKEDELERLSKSNDEEALKKMKLKYGIK